MKALLFSALLRQLKSRRAESAVLKSGLFDAEWFRAHCPNAPASDREALRFYLNGGWRPADPSARFSQADYLAMNPDVADQSLCPLAHYLLYGLREKRLRNPISVTAAKGDYPPDARRRTAETLRGRFRCRKLIRKNRKARILVCLQIFYPHAFGEISQYLRRLKPYRFDLIVSFQDVTGIEQTLRSVKRQYPRAKLIPVPNIGFDLNGFYRSLQGVELDAYDIVFKLHTKGVTHPPFYLEHRRYEKRDWFLCLYEGILGAENAHLAVDLLMNDASVGAVAAEQMIVRDIPNNRNLVRKYHDALAPELPLPRDYRFVAGTVFAMRAPLLKAFQRRTMRFDASDRAAFTSAHFEERALCFPAQVNGYRLAGLKACPELMARRAEEAKLRPENRIGEQLLADERITVSDEFAVTKLFGAPIERFELKPVPLKTLRWPIDNGLDVPITESAPYRLLMGDAAAYADYFADQQARKRPVPTAEEWLNEAARIESEPIDEKRVPIVDQNGRLLDGKEKVCCLLRRQGEDAVSTVLRLRLEIPIG